MYIYYKHLQHIRNTYYVHYIDSSSHNILVGLIITISTMKNKYLNRYIGIPVTILIPIHILL